MGNTTIEDYKNAIWGAYESLKKNDTSSFFANLTPATVRDYYAYLICQGLTKYDEEIMKLFFKVAETDSLHKVVRRTAIDKFKPIIFFLTGKTKNPDQIIRIELAAILISFADRPFHKFSKMELVAPPLSSVATQLPEVTDDGVMVTSSVHEEISPLPADVPLPLLQRAKGPEVVTGFTKRGLIVGAVAIVLCVALGYTYQVFTQRGCLMWQNDHYVEVDCLTEQQGVATLSTQVPYDATLLNVKKITPTDTTTYFKNGRALLWYCKIDSGTIELFNAPGYHPVYNKPLRPITNYMIKKYLLPKPQ